MGCCCKKKLEEINIIVNSEHFIDKKEKLMSLSDFDILKLIGEGSFAKVYLVRNKFNKKIYSMKKLNKPFIKKNKQEKYTIKNKLSVFSQIILLFPRQRISLFHFGIHPRW